DNHARSKDYWEIVKDKFNIQRFKKYDELDKSKLINHHVFIAGASGSGKTYFMQKEVMNAVENGKSCIIIDTGNSFSSDELKPELKERIGDKIKIYDVKDTALPLGLFNRKTYTKDNGMTREESANERADRISANLAKTLGMGDTQKVTLLEMIERIKSKDDFINSLYYETKNKLGNSGITMRLRKITNLKFESDETDYWRNILYGEGGNLIIFQLSSLQDEQQKIAADMIMIDLFDYVSNIHSENRAVLVLDEMQKLNTSDKAILITMLRECRKYNLDIWCSTQEPDFGQSNKMIRSIINMAGTKVYFKPPDNDMNKFARFLYGTGSGDFSLDDFKKVIKNMEHGRAIVDIGSNKWDIEKLILIPKIGEK
ncbi:MAG: DUF87 domain-containing protein, partial [Firmicutes bacterium]|nr:DUF87 domain-containing protein [Bacillota bacterium]